MYYCTCINVSHSHLINKLDKVLKQDQPALRNDPHDPHLKNPSSDLALKLKLILDSGCSILSTPKKNLNTETP